MGYDMYVLDLPERFEPQRRRYREALDRWQALRNRPHDDPAQVKRLPALRSNYFFGRKWGQGTERLTMLDIYAHQDSFVYSLVRKAYKVAVAAGLAGDR